MFSSRERQSLRYTPLLLTSTGGAVSDVEGGCIVRVCCESMPSAGAVAKVAMLLRSVMVKSCVPSPTFCMLTSVALPSSDILTLFLGSLCGSDISPCRAALSIGLSTSSLALAVLCLAELEPAPPKRICMSHTARTGSDRVEDTDRGVGVCGGRVKSANLVAMLILRLQYACFGVKSDVIPSYIAYSGKSCCLDECSIETTTALAVAQDTERTCLNKQGDCWMNIRRCDYFMQ